MSVSVSLYNGSGRGRGREVINSPPSLSLSHSAEKKPGKRGTLFFLHPKNIYRRGGEKKCFVYFRVRAPMFRRVKRRISRTHVRDASAVPAFWQGGEALLIGGERRDAAIRSYYSLSGPESLIKSMSRGRLTGSTMEGGGGD